MRCNLNAKNIERMLKQRNADSQKDKQRIKFVDMYIKTVLLYLKF